MRRQRQNPADWDDLTARVKAVLGRRGRPVFSAKQLSHQLRGRRVPEKRVRSVLRRLVEGGVVQQQEHGYRLCRTDGLIEGVFRKPGGSAREVTSEVEAKTEDCAGALPASQNRALGSLIDDVGGVWQMPADAGANDGDRVLAQSMGAKGAMRAELIEVTASDRETWIGIVERTGTGYQLVPYRDETRWRIPIARRDLHGAVAGSVVEACSLERSGRRRGGLRARVVERLGRPGSPEVDFRAIVWRRRLRVAFPDEVLAEATAIPSEIDADTLRRRLDLRDMPFLTIDPATARDHDDAICVARPTSAGVRLWVAIADVAHFVHEGTALDREAWLRGNSVYFPGRAIPMLPARLSSDLCSLEAGKDRLALVVEMMIASDGSITHSEIHSAVICIEAGLSYERAASIMEPDDSALPGDADPLGAEVVEQLRRLAGVARSLMEHRFAAGSLDLELPEPNLVIDESGRVVDVKRQQRSLAHRAVEEAMLAANRVVARALSGARIPALYRVHETPAEAALEELRVVFQTFGLLEGRSREPLTAARIAGALRKIAGRKQETFVHMVTLRAMRKARYAPENLGHFALGFDSYLHFTSPIRRYADLVTHRAVHQYLAALRGVAGKRRGRGARSGGLAMERIAVRTSARERIAMAAEREMLDLVKCEFMRPFVGREFDGLITGSATHGLYITLDEFLIEGLVRVVDLPDFFEYEPRSHSLVGRHSRVRHRLGDRVRVRVEKVDQVRGWINFSLISDRDIKINEQRRPRQQARRSSAPKSRSAYRWLP